MSLWVVPVFFGLILAYGASQDIRRWWRSEAGLPETLRWWFDQRRELRRMQHGEDARSRVFDQLEGCWGLPTAPDPVQRRRPA